MAPTLFPPGENFIHKRAQAVFYRTVIACLLYTSSGREETLERIQQGKTACMFIYPLRAACRLCGADAGAIEALTQYGSCLLYTSRCV